MNPQAENLRLVVRGVLEAYQQDALSYGEALRSLDAIGERWGKTGECPVEAERVFAPWYAFWAEHTKKVREKARREHRAPGEGTPVPIEALSSYAEVAPKPDRADHAGSLRAGALNTRVGRHPGAFKAYMLGKKLIYVMDAKTRTHYVTENHWEDYLRLRKEVPQVVRIVDRLRDLQRELFEEQGVAF